MTLVKALNPNVLCNPPGLAASIEREMIYGFVDDSKLVNHVVAADDEGCRLSSV